MVFGNYYFYSEGLILGLIVVTKYFLNIPFKGLDNMKIESYLLHNMKINSVLCNTVMANHDT